MHNVLASIIPLDLAATLSPGIFALTIVLLSSKSGAKVKLISFFAGTLIVGIVITLIGFNISQAISVEDKETAGEAIANLIIGAVFILFALKSVLNKERKLKLDQHEGNNILKWLGIGIIISATNFDALLFNFTAAKEVGGADHISALVKYLLLCLNLFFFTLPITFPVFFYVLFPKTANHVLTQINLFLIKYSRFIIALLFFILGVFFLRKGLIFYF